MGTRHGLVLDLKSKPPTAVETRHSPRPSQYPQEGTPHKTLSKTEVCFGRGGGGGGSVFFLRACLSFLAAVFPLS